jgi:hypothetical protein
MAMTIFYGILASVFSYATIAAAAGIFQTQIVITAIITGLTVFFNAGVYIAIKVTRKEWRLRPAPTPVGSD